VGDGLCYILAGGRFYAGCSPCTPRLIQKLIAATPGQGRGFWLYPVLNVMMKKVLFYG